MQTERKKQYILKLISDSFFHKDIKSERKQTQVNYLYDSTHFSVFIQEEGICVWPREAQSSKIIDILILNTSSLQ